MRQSSVPSPTSSRLHLARSAPSHMRPSTILPPNAGTTSSPSFPSSPPSQPRRLPPPHAHQSPANKRSNPRPCLNNASAARRPSRTRRPRRRKGRPSSATPRRHPQRRMESHEARNDLDARPRRRRNEQQRASESARGRRRRNRACLGMDRQRGVDFCVTG